MTDEGRLGSDGGKSRAAARPHFFWRKCGKETARGNLFRGGSLWTPSQTTKGAAAPIGSPTFGRWTRVCRGRRTPSSGASRQLPPGEANRPLRRGWEMWDGSLDGDTDCHSPLRGFAMTAQGGLALQLTTLPQGGGKFRCGRASPHPPLRGTFPQGKVIAAAGLPFFGRRKRHSPRLCRLRFSFLNGSWHSGPCPGRAGGHPA